MGAGEGEQTTLNYVRRERQRHPAEKEGQVLRPEGTAVQGQHEHCIGERPLVVQSLSLQDEKLRPGEVLSVLKGTLRICDLNAETPLNSNTHNEYFDPERLLIFPLCSEEVEKVARRRPSS